MTFNPTDEQQEALRLFATGESLVIEAGAGTGKTSTLRLLAESTSRRGQYLAFNRAIVEESKQKFPGSVRCNTAHSAAFRVMVRRLNMERLRTPRMKSWDIAARLGITSGHALTTQEGERKMLGQGRLAGLAMEGVRRFCQSADPEPTAHHAPYIKGIDFPPGTFENNRAVAKILVPYMRKAWADLMRSDGYLPFTHDHYLKAWQLDDPRIETDYILFDEAQDANPVMVAIVAAQRERAQLVWVGDSQQQIYTFTGAVNALQTVGAKQTAFLTQSFRFGPAVAAVANSVLDRIEGAQLRLRGYDLIESTVGTVERPDAILCRTNAEAVRNVLDAQKAGQRAHLVGGGGEFVSFAKAAQALMQGRTTEHPDLACFAGWAEVQDYANHDEQGADLRLNVKLIDEFGVETILAALDNMAPEGRADVVVSTAHKAKGREWNTVQLGGDFPDQPEGEELRLLYVAVTRAKMRLDHDAVALLSRPPGPLQEGRQVLDQPEAHDDPAHDFASCPTCIGASREAEHEAEGQCGGPPPEPGPAKQRPVQGRTCAVCGLVIDPEELYQAETGEHVHMSCYQHATAGGDGWMMYVGRTEGIKVSPSYAAKQALDTFKRTGKRVTVIDGDGELVVEYDR